MAILMNFRSTETLDNLYKKFGDVMYVDHWFGNIARDCYSKLYDWHNGIRVAQTAKVVIKNRTIIKRTGRPCWWMPVIQLEMRKQERLDFNENIDFALLIKNGKYIGRSCRTMFEVEKMARKSIKNDWRIEIIEALQTCIFQRQGRNKWVLVEISKGYA